MLCLEIWAALLIELNYINLFNLYSIIIQKFPYHKMMFDFRVAFIFKEAYSLAIEVYHKPIKSE